METTIVQGDYKNEDEVILKITKEVEQDPIVEEKEVRVSGIKKRIEQLNVSIANQTVERDELEALLAENDSIIKAAVN